MKRNIRKQITLFVVENQSLEIEKVREKFNIDQFKLIKAHLTLCREDELEQFEKVMINLNKLDFKSFFLKVGKPILFSSENGILLPVIGNTEAFNVLRSEILNGIIENPRNQEPHITLMHPRNSICSNEIFTEIQNYNFPFQFKFDKVSLIEQVFGKKWNIIEEFKLTDK